MNAYLVKYVVRDGGYSHPDEAGLGGGYYNAHRHLVISASTAAKAKAAVEVYVKDQYRSRKCAVKRPVLLGEV